MMSIQNAPIISNPVKRRYSDDENTKRRKLNTEESAEEEEMSQDPSDSNFSDALSAQLQLPKGNPEAISPEKLIQLLRVLTGEISRLDNKASVSFVQAILKIDWFEYDSDEFSRVYSTFLTVLVSGIPKWWNEVASMLIGDFSRQEGLEVHHFTLKYIIHVIPTSTNSIPSILKRQFPHKTAAKNDLVNYTKNLLYLLTYCDQIRLAVWQLIVENCIKLDVELQNEIEELDDDDLEEALNSDDEDEELELEPENLHNESSDEEEFMDEEEYHIDIQKVSNLSSKLDAVMRTLMDSTAPLFKDDVSSGISLFNTLATLFKSHVLPTHYTRCIQYLMFYIAQQHPDLTDSFLVMLIDIVFNLNEIGSNRVKAMQYVSSFIARAKSLSKQQLVFVMKYLTSWCSVFVAERENEISNGQGGMERFKILYCVFQGLLYIFCFRHKDLKNENDEWELNLDKFFNKLIISGFNPLKYCNETVVLIFARLAQQVDLCYCFSIIERNKRERLNGIKNMQSGAAFESKQEFLDLEAYFPFDPLILKRCKELIEEQYVEWESIDDSESE
ncbi:hypothetical protein OGAPHI_002329 [Ogataea philodendri]|uniref:RNA polymerase I-specific transcription initiation factor RRN3 n=1 Tax=Ogataea philodendri TaxID=1378263 RepID=A0A9P8PBM3_9ASCO|nr:uncharacterized protein OGAPHI_002329 [Ogataea philodendri]KAH3668575.1 hypothetical protein OGAPHI_002329 [Ogataea philodendri]